MTPLILGYACAWWHPRESTWSHTPAGLLRALRRQEDVAVVSIDAQRPLAGKAVLAAAHRLSTQNAWQYGQANRWLTDRKVRAAATRAKCNGILAVGETETVAPSPSFLYQDMGFGIVRAYIDRLGPRAPNVPRLSRRRLDALVRDQRIRYRNCAGVFTMGRWFADWLIAEEGIPADKVHAIGGGLNAIPQSRRHRESEGPRERLIFVGRDFFRKGGDLVVKAVAMLREGGDRAYRLTIVGPPRWPLQTAIPHWVDFRGAVPPAAISRLLTEHDIFVVPSWFEAYGLAFLEARAAGIPCIARDAFAMPELVPDRRAGALVRKEGGIDDVAKAIRSVSTDDALFESAADGAEQVARDHSWDAVASRAVTIIRRSTR